MRSCGTGKGFGKSLGKARFSFKQVYGVQPPGLSVYQCPSPFNNSLSVPAFWRVKAPKQSAKAALRRWSDLEN